MSNLHQLLKLMVEKGASDLHLTVNSPPQLRIDGKLHPLRMPPLNSTETRGLCYSVLTEAQKKKFEEFNELDLSFGVKGLARFRGNLFLQRNAVSGVFRQIPLEIRSFESLGLPQVLADIASRPNGLVVVTGPTGSGKSTTLAAMIDKINAERHEHILTIEDPIEFIHAHKKSIINQREVGADTESFKGALRYVLRQDPDVVLVGEMRDKDTIEAALTISETGHMCMATLHTNGAIQTINRILDVFPPHQQDQIRAQLSFSLEGIISQQLLPKATGSGRVMAMEILTPTPAIRNLIREDKLHQVYSQMQVGQSKYGMQTMNQSLFSLLQRRLITSEDALAKSPDADELRNMINGRTSTSSGYSKRS
jgi:twitching motility protein PilT